MTHFDPTKFHKAPNEVILCHGLYMPEAQPQHILGIKTTDSNIWKWGLLGDTLVLKFNILTNTYDDKEYRLKFGGKIESWKI
jgi:hypothetical protein